MKDIGSYFMYVCPACGKIYNSEIYRKMSCLHCGTTVAYTGYRKGAWENLSAEEKEIILEEVKKTPIQSMAEAKRSVWVRLLDSLLNFVILVGILASVVGAFVLILDEWFGLGVLVLVGGILGTLLSVAGLKLFLGIASDIRAIRELLQKSMMEK